MTVKENNCSINCPIEQTDVVYLTIEINAGQLGASDVSINGTAIRTMDSNIIDLLLGAIKGKKLEIYTRVTDFSTNTNDLKVRYTLKKNNNRELILTFEKTITVDNDGDSGDFNVEINFI